MARANPEERQAIQGKIFQPIYPKWRRDYLDNRKDRPMVHERAFWPVDTSDGRLKNKDKPDIDTALRVLILYGQETYLYEYGPILFSTVTEKCNPLPTQPRRRPVLDTDAVCLGAPDR